jgi:hypothetical protein
VCASVIDLNVYYERCGLHACLAFPQNAEVVVFYSGWEALGFFCRITVVAYPPMTVLAVLHVYFLTSTTHLSARGPVTRGSIGHEEQGKG